MATLNKVGIPGCARGTVVRSSIPRSRMNGMLMHASFSTSSAVDFASKSQKKAAEQLKANTETPQPAVGRPVQQLTGNTLPWSEYFKIRKNKRTWEMVCDVQHSDIQCI